MHLIMPIFCCMRLQHHCGMSALLRISPLCGVCFLRGQHCTKMALCQVDVLCVLIPSKVPQRVIGFEICQDLFREFAWSVFGQSCLPCPVSPNMQPPTSHNTSALAACLSLSRSLCFRTCHPRPHPRRSSAMLACSRAGSAHPGNQSRVPPSHQACHHS
jgi:hypothetical protein